MRERSALSDKSHRNEFTWDVLIPAFNAEATIAESIQSAISQHIGPKRILVYDDGSTDSTSDRSIAAGAEVLTDPAGINRGVGHARSALLDAARSEWVLILDADDRLLAGAITRVAKYAALLRDADCISFSSIEYEDKPSSEVDDAGYATVKRLSHEDLLQANTISSSAAFIRRESAIRVGGFRPLRRLVDYEFWLRLTSNRGQVFKVPLPVCARRVSADSITASVENAVVAELDLVSAEYLRAGHENVPTKRELGTLYRGMSRHVDYGFPAVEYFRGRESELSTRGRLFVRAIRAADAVVWRFSRATVGRLSQERPHV